MLLINFPTCTSFSAFVAHVANGLVPIPWPFLPTNANSDMKPSGVRNLEISIYHS